MDRPPGAILGSISNCFKGNINLISRWVSRPLSRLCLLMTPYFLLSRCFYRCLTISCSHALCLLIVLSSSPGCKTSSVWLLPMVIILPPSLLPPALDMLRSLLGLLSSKVSPMVLLLRVLKFVLLFWHSLLKRGGETCALTISFAQFLCLNSFCVVLV